MIEKIKIFLTDALRRVDWVLLLCTTVLSVISLVTVYGAMDNFGMSKMRMQFAMTVAGIILTFIVANLDYHVIVDRLWLVMLIFSVGILGLTLVAGDTGAGMETNNKSWITIPIIGIAIQPSEFVKITFICTFAKHLHTVKATLNQFRTLVFLGIHALLIVGLILVSGDLGVALVYMALVLIMLFCAGLHWGYFAAMGGALVVAFPFLWDYLASYQQDRIVVGFNPELDPMDKGWQPLLSKQCIENGGLFGVGWRSGGDYEQLTASHTDFILAVVGEELGYIGLLCVIAAYLLFGYFGMKIAFNSRSRFGMLLAQTITLLIVLQAGINIGVISGGLPTKGISAPMISYGGSNLLMNMIMVGLLVSVGLENVPGLTANWPFRKSK